MFREVLTINGYCCQFDITYFSQFVSNTTYLRAGTEVSDALEIKVKTQKIESNGTSTDSYLLMYIFDQFSNLTLLENSIALSPDMFFDVSVDVSMIDSSSDVTSLSVKSRNCFVESDGFNTNSYQSCVTMLLLKIAADYCQCLPFYYTSQNLNLVNEYLPCNWAGHVCIYQMLGQVQEDLRKILSNNDCYQKCDFVQYETEADFIKEDRNAREDGMTRVAVHYANNMCIKYRREVLYTWDQMLANLGGIFGLCLGGSIISIIEIIWFILEIIGFMPRSLPSKVRA
ncbi:sodium channel protein Nach-like [Leptidea sinapis]|uniref:sodium channel protein Nach-like n=1 Tax=Leptidea sinapis TaxID=189913 RepID=UPI0021C3017C|nr:sodium channel protein Nach-like [Leptidea sinapis]